MDIRRSVWAKPNLFATPFASFPLKEPGWAFVHSQFFPAYEIFRIASNSKKGSSGSCIT